MSQLSDYYGKLKRRHLERADDIALSAESAPQGYASALAEIEACVADWTPGDASSVATTDTQAVADQNDACALLIFEANGQTLGLSAEDVLKVERPLRQWPLRSQNPADRGVALREGVLGALSLDHFLEPENSQPPIGEWALVVMGRGARVAILTQRLRGLVYTSRSKLRTISQGANASRWYHDATHGVVEVLNLQRLLAPLSDAAQHSGAASPNEDASAVPRRRIRRKGESVGRGLVGRVGAFFCVFPATAVCTVERTLESALLQPSRVPCHVPLFDLALLFGLPPSDIGAARVLWLMRRGRAPLAILVQEVAILPEGLMLHPLPAVPALLSGWFCAQFQDRERCLFLLREQLLQGPLNKTLSAQLQRALRGWVPRRSAQANQIPTIDF